MSCSWASESIFSHFGEKIAGSGKEKFPTMAEAAKSMAAAQATGSVIVVVEDNPADVLLLREALAKHQVGSHLYLAHDGEEGVRLIDAIDEANLPCPDLILIDLNLPRRSGFEVLARARASRQCAEKPVVILSSSGAASDREKAASLGASGYIRKPSTLKEFLSIGESLKGILRDVQ